MGHVEQFTGFEFCMNAMSGGRLIVKDPNMSQVTLFYAAMKILVLKNVLIFHNVVSRVRRISGFVESLLITLLLKFIYFFSASVQK